MASITDIKKLNVRSPYFVEVVDEYLGGVIPPEPDPEPEVPVVIPSALECSDILFFGTIVGLKKFTLDTTGKELGEYSFIIANAKVPIKFRAYTEGDTLPAYTTIGLDNYTNEWLLATGEDANSLSSEDDNPDGVTQRFTYTTDSVTTEISKNMIIEMLAPIPTINTMSITSDSCQPLSVANSPETTDFVTVVTVVPNSLYSIFDVGTPVEVSDITITLNGFSYTMPNTSNGSGIRLIAHDSTPDYVVLTNNNPYGTQSNVNFFRSWSYTNTTPSSFNPTLIPQEIGSSFTNTGINELKVEFGEGIGGAVRVLIGNHPVSNHPTIPQQRVINHKGDGTWTYMSTLYGTVNLGNRDVQSSESITLRFSGINEKYLTVNNATYQHEGVVNEGDLVERFDDVTRAFSVAFAR
jgi:hypothetical protein